MQSKEDKLTRAGGGGYGEREEARGIKGQAERKENLKRGRGRRQSGSEREKRGAREGGGGCRGGGEKEGFAAIDHAGGSVLLRKTSIKRSRADSATINSTYKSCPVTP